MSYTTFKPNDTVFVTNIGYGTLLDCGNFNVVSFKVPGELEKRDSIYFDPDLFNSDDSSSSKKNEKQSVQVPKKASEPAVETVQSKVEKKEAEKQEVDVPINIVKVRIDGTKAIAHIPDTSIKKNVIVRIKPMFARSVGIINVQIDINKTIESLKKQIFQELGLKIAYYYNIKLFTTSPTLSELSVHSKTVMQYAIMESSIIVVTADHGFSFQALPQGLEKFYSLPNNNMTFVALKREPAKIPDPPLPISLPPPPQEAQKPQEVSIQTEPQKQIVAVEEPPKVPQVQASQPEKQKQKQMEIAGDKKPEAPKPAQQQVSSERKEQTVVQSPKKMPTQEKKNVAGQSPSKNNSCQVAEMHQIKGEMTISSGKHYWEVKIDKLPKKQTNLQIGLFSEKTNKSWIYMPIVSQKFTQEGESQGEKTQYGIGCKEGDSIGVLVHFNKEKIGKVNFYKNNVGLGTCFKDVSGEVRPLFGLGSEGQISLDTRAPIPIDSYRFS